MSLKRFNILNVVQIAISCLSITQFYLVTFVLYEFKKVMSSEIPPIFSHSSFSLLNFECDCIVSVLEGLILLESVINQRVNKTARTLCKVRYCNVFLTFTLKNAQGQDLPEFEVSP